MRVVEEQLTAPEDGSHLNAGADELVGVAQALRHDLDSLFSKHPLADTLSAAAIVLADLLDGPMVRVTPHIAPGIVRELRATVTALVEAEGADEDDPFGFAGGAPMVVPASG